MTIDGLNQSCCFPMAVWDRVVDTLIARTPTIASSHVRLRAGFIEKDELADVQTFLSAFPSIAIAFDVRPLLFASPQLFFCVYALIDEVRSR